MARTVVVRPIATANLREYARNISRRVSQASADRWLAAIQAIIERLATEADRHPEADEAADLGIDLREQLHGRRPHVYRILFTIDGDTTSSASVTRPKIASRKTTCDRGAVGHVHPTTSFTTRP